MTAVREVSERSALVGESVAGAISDAMAQARLAAAALLGCRNEATAQEVRSAFRARVLEARPDTGGADGQWVEDVKQARALLLAAAAPERRREPRRSRSAESPSAYLPLRRATWTPDAGADRVLDLRL